MGGCSFFGKPVKKFDKNDAKGRMIVIASEKWREIVPQLAEAGLKPFKDFVLCEFILENCIDYSELYDLRKISDALNEYMEERICGRKIAVVYGHCQTEAIEKGLSLNQKFSEDYIIVKTPKVCWFDFRFFAFRNILKIFINDVKFWNSIDLFIYITVTANNRFSADLATDKLMLQLHNSCKKVNIVTCYFNGYFPQVQKDKFKVDAADAIRWGDKYVYEYWKSGMTTEDIITAVLDENYIDKEEIMEGVRLSFNELKRREEKTDIKISDYIIENYKKRQLFYSPGHPSIDVLIEYTERILQYLGYDTEEKMSEIDFFLKAGSLKRQDVPLYPAVIKALGLSDYEDRYYPNRYFNADVLLSIEEWIRAYIRLLETMGDC